MGGQILGSGCPCGPVTRINGFRMRWTLLLTFLALLQGQDTSDDDRLDFSTTFVGRVKSDEEVVQGTISLNGTITPESVSKLNWAAQNALVQACGHGSKVLANSILELSWITRRGVDIKFSVLPRLGGGGDCARTLVESSAGGYEPPFPVNGAKRKPIFRNMMQNELSILGFATIMTDMYLRLWRVTCQQQPVWRNGNSLTELNAATVCSTYANGWEVYLEPSITEPATATGYSLGYSAGNGGSVMGQFTDSCMVANSPCFCSSMQSCGWRLREDGVTMHCRTLDSGDTSKAVSCTHCAQQPGCPPTCSSASFACQCASIGATCHWDASNAECVDGAASSGDNVPCSECALQDKCQALRPTALEFRPKSIFALTRSGPKSMIEVDFNMPLALPGLLARGFARFICGTDGRQPATNSLQLLEYVVPANGLFVNDKTLQLASGTVEVLEPTECTLVLSDGVVNGQADGLPSKPVDFGSFFFKLKDSIPPKVSTLYPETGAGAVPPKTRFIVLTFTERIRTTANFSATLTRTDLFGTPQEAPRDIGIESVRERTLNLNIEGILEPGRFYQLEISPESVIDYGSLAFGGLQGEAYKFKTEGQWQDVTKIDGTVAASLPAAVVAGIVAGAVILVLTGIILCYKAYVAASEKHEDEVKIFNQEGKTTSKDEKGKGPPPVFGEDALRDMQIDQLPETPDARKQGAILFAFDEDGDGDTLRKAAMMEEGKTAPTNRRVSRASLRAEAFADPHPSNKTGHHHHHHHHHDHGRGSSHSATNEPSNGHGHQRTAPSNSQSNQVRSNQAATVRPPTSSKKESPKKEPPKLKPGFFLRAWDSKSSS